MSMIGTPNEAHLSRHTEGIAEAHQRNTYIATGNLKRGNVTASNSDALHSGSDRVDNATKLVTKDVTLVHLYDSTFEIDDRCEL